MGINAAAMTFPAGASGNSEPPMPIDPANTIYYRRARFTTRLPVDRQYVASHFWLLEVAPGCWRVGLTKFATRMLGDLVEYDFSIAVGEAVRLGQPIGSVEGFKAVAELYCVASGTFAGGNPALNQDPTLVDADPYDRGWLYEVHGQSDPVAMGASGYVELLDSIIDRLLEQSNQHQGDDTCFRPDIS
jgi:glycine cleavage system H protein